jgi:ketosteroid isomerase-like protein
MMEFLVNTSNQTSADEADVLDAVLTRWKAAVDAHQPEHAAALFATDAIFQGLHPYTVGSVIIRQDADGWRIVHYQVSRLD